MKIDILIPTRGDMDNLAACIGGLIAHIETDHYITLRIFPPEWEPTPQVIALLEIIRRRGHGVSIEIQDPARVGNLALIRRQSFVNNADVVLSLDDDIILASIHHNPIERLADKVLHNQVSFAVPIIRYVQNFTDKVSKRGHTEIWEKVAVSDYRLRIATAVYGDDWIRVYDIGRDTPIKVLGGSCFCLKGATANQLALNENIKTYGFEDIDISLALWDMAGVKGIATPDVYAYHFGYWSNQKWTENAIQID